MGEVLRDASGRRIGEIRENAGVKVARDANGRRVGEYDASTGETRDASGRRVGTGTSWRCVATASG